MCCVRGSVHAGRWKDSLGVGERRHMGVSSRHDPRSYNGIYTNIFTISIYAGLKSWQNKEEQGMDI